MTPAPGVPIGADSLRFGPLDITFDERVLRPRPWTAAHSAWAADILRSAPPGDVLELCTGAGQIGLLSIASNERRLVAVDLDATAVAFARENAEAAGLGDRVEVREGRLEDVLREHERFVMVIADPPWVSHREMHRFPDDPVLAIDGGGDGLVVARACLEVAETHLEIRGSALLQLGTVEQMHQISDWAAGRDRLRVTDLRVIRDEPGNGPGSGAEGTSTESRGGVVVRLERIEDAS